MGERIKEMQKKKSSYHHGDLKRALMQSAVELISEVGPEGFTLIEVCRKAGVSQNAPYRHYKNVEALLAAIAVEGYKELYVRTSAMESKHHSPLDSLKKVAMAYVQFSLDFPAQYRVMFDQQYPPEMYPELDEALDRSFDVARQLVEACRKEGLMRGGTAMDHTYLCWTMVHGLARLVSSGRLSFPTKEAQMKFIRFSIRNALGHWPH